MKQALSPTGAAPAMKCPNGYTSILVQSFRDAAYASGHRYEIGIRPLPGQGFPVDLYVECANQMRSDYPEGTIFRICVTEKQKLDCRPHLYSSYRWPFEVVRQ